MSPNNKQYYLESIDKLSPEDRIEFDKQFYEYVEEQRAKRGGKYRNPMTHFTPKKKKRKK